MGAGWIAQGPDQPAPTGATPAQPGAAAAPQANAWTPVGPDTQTIPSLARPHQDPDANAIENTRNLFQATRDVLFGHTPEAGETDRVTNYGILPSIAKDVKDDYDHLTSGPSWSTLAQSYPHLLGANIEKVKAGYQEAHGAAEVQDAGAQLAALNVLPQVAARMPGTDDATKVQAMAKDPVVNKTARSVGLDPVVFANMWLQYSGLSPEEQADRAAQAQTTLADGRQNLTSGKSSRIQAWADETAWQPSDLKNGKLDPWSLKGVAFNTALAVPSLAATAAATVAGTAIAGPAGGIAAGGATAAAVFAPAQREDVVNQIDSKIDALMQKADDVDRLSPVGQKRDLNPVSTEIRQQAADLAANQQKIADTAGFLYAAADAVGATPVSAVLARAPGGQAVLNRIVGATIAKTMGGKVAGAAIANGAGGIVQASLQKAIDVGIVHEDQPLSSALKDIAYTGVISAITAAPIAAAHAAVESGAAARAARVPPIRNLSPDELAARVQGVGNLGTGPADTGPLSPEEQGYTWNDTTKRYDPPGGAGGPAGAPPGARGLPGPGGDGTTQAPGGTNGPAPGTNRGAPETNAAETEAGAPGARTQADTYAAKVEALNTAAAKAEKRSDISLQPEEDGWSVHVNGVPAAHFDTAANAREALAQARKLVGTAPATPAPAAAPVSAKPTTLTDITEAGEGAPPDRRVDTASRQRIDAMSPDEMRTALYTHELTGIPNRRAYEDSVKKPIQVSADVDSLKWANDNMGHAAGDQMLKAVATALHEASGGNAYHLSGDEFAVQGDTPEQAQAAMADAQNRLAGATLTFEHPDGRTVTLKGIGISHGQGVTLDRAEAALGGAKAARQQLGVRAGRGEQPPGARIEARGAGVPTEVRKPAASQEAGLPGELRAPPGQGATGALRRAIAGTGKPEETPAVPTAGQAQAGNYFKPTVNWRGLPIKLEHIPGQKRAFTYPNGKPGVRTMKAPYGYFPSHTGADGDGVDAFIGGTGPKAHIIDQLHPDGTFDEHKVVVGSKDTKAAERLYLSHYQKGWTGLGKTTEVSSEQLGRWLKHGDLTKPYAWKPPSVGLEAHLAHPETREELERMAANAGWHERGGKMIRIPVEEGGRGNEFKISRTKWIPKEPWFAELAERLPEKGRGYAEALAAAAKGEKISALERRVLTEMGDRARTAYDDWRHSLSPEQLDAMTSKQQSSRLSALEEEEARLEAERERQAIQAEANEDIPFAKGQGDLFGHQVQVRNEIAKAKDAIERKLGKGREHVGADVGRRGDLFSAASRQVDIEDKQPADKLIAKLRRYASGMSRVGDIAAGVHGTAGTGKLGVGVDIGELSMNAIDKIGRAVAHQGADVFVDSGAFSLFRKGLKNDAGVKPLDFDKILSKYDALEDAVAEHDPAEEGKGSVLFVMPDIVGDQKGSLELVERYKQWIKAQAMGERFRPVIPIQKGDLSLAQAYNRVKETLGTDKFVTGVPSNEAAANPQDLAELFAEKPPGGVHFLGAMHDAKLGPKIQAMVKAGYTPAHLTADGNLLRSALYGRQETGGDRKGSIVSTLRQRAAEYGSDEAQRTLEDKAAIEKRGHTVLEHEATYGQVSEPPRARGAAARRNVHTVAGVPAQLDIFAQSGNAASKRAAAQLSNRAALSKIGEFSSPTGQVDTWRRAAAILGPLRKSPQEFMGALVLDKDLKPLAVIRHTLGTVAGASVEPWSLAGAVAQVPGAHSVYYVHNHPSGSPAQSNADMFMTTRLEAMMRGSGISTRGMVVVSPGSKEASFMPPGVQGSDEILGESDESPGKQPGVQVPLMARELGEASGKHPVLGMRISSPDIARRVVGAAALSGHESGVLLIDTRHTVRGIVPMSNQEMLRLRTGDTSTSQAALLAKAAEANTQYLIPWGQQDAVKNVQKFGNAVDIKPLDGFYKSVSGEWNGLASEGGNETSGAFLKRAPTLEYGKHLSAQDVERQVGKILSSFRTKPADVVVVPDIKALRAEPDFAGRNLPDETHALMDPRTGKLFFVASEMHSPEYVASLVAHEYVTHFGLRAAFGSRRSEEYQAILEGVAKAAPAMLRELQEQYYPGRAYKPMDREQRLNAAEEVLAHHAEAYLKDPSSIPSRLRQWWDRLHGMIRDWVRKALGLPQKFDELFMRRTLADLASFLRRNRSTGSDGRVPSSETEPARAEAKDTFYSGLARAVDAAKREKGTGAEWEATLKNMPGVKQGELDWTGIKEFLAGKGRVTKQEVADYVASHQVQLGEVHKGTPQTLTRLRDVAAKHGWAIEDAHDGGKAAFPLATMNREEVRPTPTASAPFMEDWNDLVAQHRELDTPAGVAGMNPTQQRDRRAYLERAMDHVHNQMVSATIAESVKDMPPELAAALEAYNGNEREQAMEPTKFSSWATPGGENYREMLLTLGDSGEAARQKRELYEARQEVMRAEADETVARRHAWDMADYKVHGLSPHEFFAVLKRASDSHEGIAEKAKEALQGIIEKHGPLWREELADAIAKSIEAGRQTRAANVRDAEARKADSKSAFRGSHWDEANVLAHTRFDDRVGPNGERVLHIHEIQSDWHQRGRDFGYIGATQKEAQARFDEYSKELAAKYGLNPAHNLAMFGGMKQMRDQELNKYERLQHEALGYQLKPGLEVRQDGAGKWNLYDDGTDDPRDTPGFVWKEGKGSEDAAYLAAYQDQMLAEQGSQKQVPDAPFKGSSSWGALAMKRMMRYAAENGYDKLSWDTGSTNAERYNMQQVADTIHVFPESGGVTYRMIASKNKRTVTEANELTPEKLVAYIGKDLAQRAISNIEANKANGLSNETAGTSLKGDDLKVGGSGMRGFYDDILPKMVDKLAKKWGTSTHSITLGGEPREAALARSAEMLDNLAAEQTWRSVPVRNGEAVRRIVDREGRTVDLPRNGELAQALVAHNELANQSQGEQIPAHAIDITEAMRNSVMEGQPMFKRRPKGPPIPKGPPGRARRVYDLAARGVAAIPGNELALSLRRIADPSGVSSTAQATALLAREAFGELAQASEEALHNLQRFAKAFDLLGHNDRMEFIYAMEEGRQQPIKEHQAAADALRKLMDDWRDKIRDLGIGALDNFIENYFPHIWKDVDGAKKWFGQIFGRRPLKGPASFLKERTIPTTREGIEKGFTPVSTNPLVLVFAKVREMQRFYTGVKLMQAFKDQGLARFLPSHRPMPEGFAEINDAVGRVRQWSEAEQGFIERGKYIMPADAARVINNHLGASALRNFLPAQLFRSLTNVVTPLQLSFSAFHLGFTTLDAVVSKNALAVERMLHGEPIRALKAMLEANGVLTGPILNLRRGNQLLKAYTNISGATPEMRRIVEGLMASGGRVKMDNYFAAGQGKSPFRQIGFLNLAHEVRAALTQPHGKLVEAAKVMGGFPREYATRLMGDLREIWETHPGMAKLAVPLEIAGRTVRASTAIIMEHLVPLQKLGVFSDLAADHIRRNPGEDPVAFAAAMQSIWNSVDNRLGEMVYDNVFWNRTFKDVSHMTVRAVGWNLGTVRELGGAPVDAVKLLHYMAQGAPPEDVAPDLNGGAARLEYENAKHILDRIADKAGHKIAYTVALVGTTMILGAITSALFGQKIEELKDYFFPKTGGVTKQGTPARISLPSYMKDVYEYADSPFGTVINKANPMFGIIHALGANEDFYGDPTRGDPDAPFWSQVWNGAKYAAKATAPFAIQGAQQLNIPGHPGLSKALPYFGITPSPARITSPEQMERYQHEQDQKAYQRKLQRDMRKAAAAGDQIGAAKLRQELLEEKVKVKQTERAIRDDKIKARDAAKKVSSLIQGKSKPDAVAALKAAGLPAFAQLWQLLPERPKERVAKALEAYA